MNGFAPNSVETDLSRPQLLSVPFILTHYPPPSPNNISILNAGIRIDADKEHGRDNEDEQNSY